jgi:hypothetical protein
MGGCSNISPLVRSYVDGGNLTVYSREELHVLIWLSIYFEGWDMTAARTLAKCTILSAHPWQSEIFEAEQQCVFYGLLPVKP